MKIIWLGQGGFLLETEGQRLLIDPFLSNIVEERQGLKRLVEPPLTIEELRPDYVFITHNHLDHFDPVALPEIHRQYSKALIGGPESVMQKAKDFDFNPSVLDCVNKGETEIFGNYKITATPAFHTDPYSVGCIVKVEGKTIYISGDSLFDDHLSDEINRLAQTKIDTVIICINGKLGNMTWQEALKVVEQLQPTQAIPMHYGMFAENTVDPTMFLEGCKKLNVQPLELLHGIQVEI